MANFDELVLLGAIGVLEEVEMRANEPQRTFHQRDDAFDLSDRQFVGFFRLTKDLVRLLITMLEPFIPEPSRSSALDIQTKVLVALKFYAAGGYQLDTGSNYHLAVSQPSVSRCIQEVTEALNRPEIFGEWVKFPQRIEEFESLRRHFYELNKFPGVIGCIDCTHIAIFPPKKDDPVHPEHLYLNRKNYHSINMQLVCDWKLKILSVNARFPGSMRDAYIWENSAVKDGMMQLHQRYPGDFYLLGDSGYPLRPWLLTPLEEDPQPDSPEEAYNTCHKRTHSIVEKCNRVLKNRFRCLLKHKALHYAPNVASKIINACIMLHNMCIEHNVPEPEVVKIDDMDLGIFESTENGNARAADQINHPEFVEGRSLQRHIVNNYFS